ncbi:Choline-sulfatase [Lysobacter capsici AZ78]|uniref:Choline-sulfatase n=1 Tax=Lysobacter capsici AZ78 TaxID=1444315 RepID=A0A108U9Q6_9GAMM|nr:sulfatase-like hydrolase/transferase [Lysobacter capsici]KWS05158.1 Choline-sulfatase [Lysobacter capsici AZ78]
MALSDLFSNGKRPNLLLIITDQERSLLQWPASYQPTLAAAMPAMRQLAANGIDFQAAFTGACMCSPSRATFLTSQYPAVTGCTHTGGAPLPPPSQFPNLASVLKAAGYGCYWIGKWHLLGNNEPGTQDDELAQWGFSTWDPNDAGISLNATFLGGGTLDTGPVTPGAPNQNDQRYLADALSFLAAPPAEPYCLVVSLVNPHDVHLGYLNQAASYYDPTTYRAAAAPIPLNADENLSSKPRAQSSYTFAQMSGNDGATEQDFVDFYAYLVGYVDSQIQQILDAMSAEQIDQTLIVRFADHGELGLSHGMVEKFVNVYDEAIHVPLLFSNPIAWPQPQSTQALASSVDLLPTLANLLGVSSQFPGLAGTDLSPLLEGTGTSVQDYVHYTYDDIGGNGPSVIRAIRSAQWTYAVYAPAAGAQSQGGDWELYDLSADPQQNTNLAGNPAYADQQAVLEAELAVQMKEKGTTPAGWPPQYIAGTSRGGPAA